MAKPGWQTREVACPHLGVIFSFPGLKPVGAEWMCHCGQMFVVAMVGDNKVLKKKLV